MQITKAASGGYRASDKHGRPVGDIFLKDGLYRFLPRERYGTLGEEELDGLLKTLRSLNGPLAKREARVKACHASVIRTGRDYKPSDDTTCPFEGPYTQGIRGS